jgi:hypothetical protein
MNLESPADLKTIFISTGFLDEKRNQDAKRKRKRGAGFKITAIFRVLF